MGLGIENKVSSVFFWDFPTVLWSEIFSNSDCSELVVEVCYFFFLICFVYNSKYEPKNTHYKYPSTD